MIKIWNPTEVYNMLDTVEFLDSIYVSVKDNNIGVVPMEIIRINAPYNYSNEKVIDLIINNYSLLDISVSKNLNNEYWKKIKLK